MPYLIKKVRQNKKIKSFFETLFRKIGNSHRRFIDEEKQGKLAPVFSIRRNRLGEKCCTDKNYRENSNKKSIITIPVIRAGKRKKKPELKRAQ